MSKYLHALPQGLDNPAKYSEQQGQWTEMMVVDVYRTQKKLRNELGMQICVKAGGKRVVKKSTDDNGNVEKETKKFDKTRSLPTPSRMQHLGLLLAGPLEKFGHDYPEIPVSVRHSRVRPSAEKPHVPRIPCIQQPRKF